jgi:CRISPR type I-D-associated protein Csc2
MPQNLLDEIKILSQGMYLQFVVDMKLLDDAIIRSNEPEEVLTQRYDKLGDRFIIPWRKTKGKLRRAIMEHQRGLAIGENCFLKDNLCMSCPSCLLFGGTGEVSAAKVPYNLLSRVLGDTWISQQRAEGIGVYTANAVDEMTLTTGQALMTIIKVPVETLFRGVVTLRDPTPELTSILIDGIGRVTRIGASTREWGRVRTDIRGWVYGDREILASYELATMSELPELANVDELPLTNVDVAYQEVQDQFAKLLEEEDLPAATKKGRGKGRSRRRAPAEVKEENEV